VRRQGGNGFDASRRAPRADGTPRAIGIPSPEWDRYIDRLDMATLIREVRRNSGLLEELITLLRAGRLVVVEGGRRGR